jgi:NADH dehydrogenase
MLPEVISGSIGLLDVITPIRRLCPRTNLYTREVESIDLANRTVTTSAGFRPRPTQIEYDHLVIAAGNVTNFAGQPGLAEHALPFKYLGDGLILRNHVIHALEEADIESDPEFRKALLTFVVAGGGFSGVEAVAELNDFVRNVAKSFRNISPKMIRVVLLHSGPLILPELKESLAQFAQKLLKKRGVELRLNTRLAGATAESAILAGGERIPTKTLVSTVPSAPNPIVASLPVKKEKGRIVVNKYLEVVGQPGLWALGDCAWVVDQQTWLPCPPTAQHAIREGNRLAANIVATIRDQPKQPFSFQSPGKLAALGHHSAVAELMGLKVSGFIAWILWRGIYLMKLPGFDRKVRVATDWLLDLVLPSDIVQLKMEKTASYGREHFEANEIIFRQGDVGDRLYVIVDGQIELIKKDSAGEHVIGRLGPGACFGEMAVVNDAPRMATARTVTSANLLSLDQDAFNALFSHLPPVRRMFERLIDQRMRGDEGEMTALGTGTTGR